MPEYVPSGPLELLKNPQPSLNHDADFQSRAAGQACRERRAAQHHPPRTIDLKAHQFPPSAGEVACGDLVFGDAEPRHVLERKVNAVLAEVDFHILPEVDELQGRADRVGTGETFTVGFSIRIQDHPPDGIIEETATVHELVKVGIAELV